MDKSISSQVTTPVTAQDLSAALISALESNTVSPVSAPNDVTFDILLAEDNLVNQKLAVKILEKYGDKDTMDELARKRETVKDILNVVDPSLLIGEKMSKYWCTA